MLYLPSFPEYKLYSLTWPKIHFYSIDMILISTLRMFSRGPSGLYIRVAGPAHAAASKTLTSLLSTFHLL